MTTSPNNPPSPIRPEEADLLAWIEGEKLSPEMDAAVARLLMSNPVLARELEAMRRDRDVMKSLEDEFKAPAGLIESVESALQPVLERQLLLGLQDGEPVESKPVVSMVRPEKRGVFQTFLADRSGRRMAMAAGLLLVVGGATYWATTMVSNTGGPRPLTVARNDAIKETPIPEAPAKLLARANPAAITSDKPAVDQTTNEKMTVAVAPAKVVEPTGAPGVPGSAVSNESKSSEVETAMIGPVKVAVDSTLAAELAREGKLVIRVVSPQAARSPVAVAEHLKKDVSGPGWKLAGDVPSAVAVAVAPEPVDWKQLAASQPAREDNETVAAADMDGVNKALDPSLIGPPAPSSLDVPQLAIEQVPSVYMLQARLDAATMDAVKKSLQKAGRADEVVFEERYESLPLDPSAPILNPSAMVWWNNTPAGWAKWGEVPVVIDPKR